MAKLTNLGKEIRKLRLDRDERLTEMAARIGKSAAYLSAVETGRRPAPDDMIEAIIVTYDLSGDKAESMRSLGDQEREAFTLRPASPLARDTAGMLARRMNSLSHDDLEAIQNILKNHGKKTDDGI
jgi:transcriptional regulator with XRE-family HTH domain